MTEHMNPLLDVDETATFLKLSKWQIYRLASQKRLPSIRIGRSLRFRPMDLEAWLDDQSIKVIRDAGKKN